jgi:hypothetical protein
LLDDAVDQKTVSVESYHVILVLDEFDDQLPETRDFIGTIIEVLLEKLKLFMHEWGHILVIKNIDCIELTKEGVKNEY